MRGQLTALDGAWNLHHRSLENTRGMSKEQILKVCDMKEKGAENLNFQVGLKISFILYDSYRMIIYILSSQSDPVEVDQCRPKINFGLLS
jgi:hypothetical protein